MGELVYQDTNRRAVTRPITSHRLQLTGKPDYVYRTEAGTVPVEIKKHAAGRWGPRDRDIVQLLAYCVLVEDVWGATVTHGLIEYGDGQRFPIPYGSEERARVLALAGTIRQSRRAVELGRDHQDAWKCRRCRFADTCEEALAP